MSELAYSMVETLWLAVIGHLNLGSGILKGGSGSTRFRRHLGEGKDEACYRVITPAFAGTPLSGMGAARQGGRFNRPGQEALYLSADDATVRCRKSLPARKPDGFRHSSFSHGRR
ncbi:RES family NAD+ phosphorylase [Billgrantia endophytica]|uniref:RES family NAD+ phosphorylase n=1 Tax=Billgrantia endophytica TaxID=2033802 RepID=UPI00197B05A0|nr:RES domain-containing protein [Halomonas endophytica]